MPLHTLQHSGKQPNYVSAQPMHLSTQPVHAPAQPVYAPGKMYPHNMCASTANASVSTANACVSAANACARAANVPDSQCLCHSRFLCHHSHCIRKRSKYMHQHSLCACQRSLRMCRHRQCMRQHGPHCEARVWARTAAKARGGTAEYGSKCTSARFLSYRSAPPLSTLLGYRCVCTTGTIRHRAVVQSKSQREMLFSDMSWAPLAKKKSTLRNPQPYGDVWAVTCGVLLTLSRQQAAHAGHERKRKACQGPKNNLRRLSRIGLLRMDSMTTDVRGEWRQHHRLGCNSGKGENENVSTPVPPTTFWCVRFPPPHPKGSYDFVPLMLYAHRACRGCHCAAAVNVEDGAKQSQCSLVASPLG